MTGLIVLSALFIGLFAFIASLDFFAGALSFRRRLKEAKKLTNANEGVTIRRQARQDDSAQATISIATQPTSFMAYSAREISELESNDALSLSLKKLNALGGIDMVSNHGSSLEVEFTLTHDKDLNAYLDVAKEIAGNSQGLCPQCNISLSVEKGMIHEHPCSQCGGRFVPQEGVARYVIERLNVEISSLKEQLNEAQKSSPCPLCKTQMGRVFINEVIADLCSGCGGMWFDKGELTQLSDGEVREI